MKGILKLSVAAVLSLVFTASLVYASLQIPEMVDNILNLFLIDAPDIQRVDDLRLIGYVSFSATWLLILAGFLTKRSKLSTSGSILSILPIFGYFATYMFFLAGIGVIRIFWVPLMDLSPNILKLGHIVYIPYLLIELLATPVHLAYTWPSLLSYPLSLIVTRIGLLIFSFSTITWLYGRFRGLNIIDFWIYRYSRHPQYLGFLLWSYGMLHQGTIEYPPGGRYVPPPSLPWLISAITIIGVALYEERIMISNKDVVYAKYRDSTSFIIPLPKQLSSIVTAPMKFLMKKSLPETRKEIFYMMILYCFLLILFSLPLVWILPF